MRFEKVVMPDPDLFPKTFDRCNLFELPLERECAHCGEGDVFARRIAVPCNFAGTCNYIDYAEVPPGSSIGRHRHEPDEEEFYLVLDGHGEMWRDGDVFPVRAGDLIRNSPGGAHGLRNVGSKTIRLFVFELAVAP
ncbi:cupin domain-containing protein [Bradyrhizobium sp. CCGUVB23]|uniref:cupin domain-containing protein n=1 Tax=Bradyrhizobium sp. CCGUVB23 TaxID=2949630 RepID=UPI0020B1A38C|nr:cupin domain-containing protein [Bradyrhizobium sp. CCGUVB23]MCP3468388.1 cupin domain-containing protein [Bradyrhizobium sp. CCGUVB23]